MHDVDDVDTKGIHSFLQRRWCSLLLALECLLIIGLGSVHDYYYRGHSVVVGKWRYWSIGVCDGNFVTRWSPGEDGIFGDLHQAIMSTHAPTLGNAPSLHWSPQSFEAIGPLWLSLIPVIGWIAFREARRRVKRKAACQIAKTLCAPDSLQDGRGDDLLVRKP